LSLAVFAGIAFCDNEARLTADSMNYDPATGRITAFGNVRFMRPDGEIFGDRGAGNANGRDFEVHGNVRGNFTREAAEIVCESLFLSSAGESPLRRKITASGDVILTRDGDRMSAQTITWEMDRDNYKATGEVIGTFAQYSIDSDLIARNEDKIWAHNIRRYEDRDRGLFLSAGKASGIIRESEVVELIADGEVIMSMPDNMGVVSRATGDKCVFSLDRGTIVISGNAAVKQGERRLNASSIVYHLDSGRIDALGQPTLVFETPRN
ncbi:MAG: hypothetical protein LBT08_01855, partial [Synergistaceae bacterium]|nr:hypothetical protein [Synergistaceae bacterium]